MKLYPAIEPHEHGMLTVGDGHRVYWETCGNPAGKPALVLHGGPGSGCTGWHRRLFDPEVYRIVLFDQRGCGRSSPHAGEPTADLSANTTGHLLNDIDLLRERLGIDRWLILGGSWGSTLALAYAESHPDCVTGMVLFGVTTGRYAEFDWLFRGGLAPLFPAEWERLIDALPSDMRDGDIVEAYAQLLNAPGPDVHQPAAESWCLWESATPAWPPRTGLADRFRDPRYALAFARIVTHYVRHNAWLDDGELLRGARALASIPGVLINGRFDLQAPLGNAWDLHRAWPGSQLVVVENASHEASHEGITAEILRATSGFACTDTVD